MKRIIFLLSMLVTLCANSQLVGMRTNLSAGGDSALNWYGTFSPGNTPSDSRTLLYARFHQSNYTSRLRLSFDSVEISSCNYLANNGTPSNIASYNDSGRLQRSPLSLLSIPAAQITGLSAVATTGSYNDLSSKPDTAVMLSNYQRKVPVSLTLTSRSIGTVLSTTTAYQPSSVYDMDLSYGIDLTLVSALAGTNGGTITLYTSSSSGGTYTAFRSVTIQFSGVLSSTLQTQTLVAKVPKLTWCKLVYSNIGPNANSAAIRDGGGQETPIQ